MMTINAHDLKNRIEKDDRTLVLDVLPKDHYRSGHVPGARNVPLGDAGFVDAVGAHAQDKQQPIVVYCANTECDLSPKAAERLQDLGYENVADFEGGIEEWKAAGFAVEES